MEDIKKVVNGNFSLRQAMMVIPKGDYCYDSLCGKCPFWDSKPSMGHQQSGYCHWMGVGDWHEDGTILLWDQVKECGVNHDDDDDDDDDYGTKWYGIGK